MGNFCSICYPGKSFSDAKRPSRRFSDTDVKVCDSDGQNQVLLQAQLESNEDVVQVPLSQVGGAVLSGVVRSESSLLCTGSTVGSGQGGPQTTCQPANQKMEKKSLALKLSGTLNRNNSESRHISETKISNMFDKYKDSSEDSILAQGVEQFCIDLQLKPEEFKVLVLAWKFEAEVMCRFTRQEFIQGCKAMNVDSIKGIQNKLPELVTQTVNEPELFKDLYRFTFKFGLDSLSGQRILPVDMAVSLWALVFSQEEPPILKRWIHFLDKHPQVRGIPRDTWNMFLNFVETVSTDLSHYDDTEAWPSLFDDFVEFENDQLNQNSSTMQDLNNQAAHQPVHDVNSVHTVNEVEAIDSIVISTSSVNHEE